MLHNCPNIVHLEHVVGCIASFQLDILGLTFCWACPPAIAMTISMVSACIATQALDTPSNQSSLAFMLDWCHTTAEGAFIMPGDLHRPEHGWVFLACSHHPKGGEGAEGSQAMGPCLPLPGSNDQAHA